MHTVLSSSQQKKCCEGIPCLEESCYWFCQVYSDQKFAFYTKYTLQQESKTVLKLKQNYVIEVECKSTDECTLLKIKRATERAISKSNIQEI